jgi:D-glycero-D-manno-heptose 1,7-bisphosphate phosphatase
LAKHFKHIFVVTNQRGIGKGIFTEENLADIHSRMVSEIEKVGGRIDKIYYSTALSDYDTRRKPNKGMYDEIMNDYPDVTPEKTLMVGDGDVDEDFASNCGVGFFRVDSLKKENGNYKWIKT